jgi:transposase
VRLVTTALPKELFRRSFLAPSMIAHLLVSKYLLGVPFYRVEQAWALQGFSLDLCRYAEDTGATLGAIVEAARKDALINTFCLSTDATGVRVQPGPLMDRGGKPGPCRKGHFFVTLADRDHVFFEFQARHTSAAVCEMFRGFTGYIQADGHTVYDALFAGRSPPGVPITLVEEPPPTEVGCWIREVYTTDSQVVVSSTCFRRRWSTKTPVPSKVDANESTHHPAMPWNAVAD